MKINSLILGAAAAGCAMGIVLPQHVSAAVSDADFNALKDLVQQMNGKLQSLEQTNQLDQQTIQQLQQQLGDTKKTAAMLFCSASSAVFFVSPNCCCNCWMVCWSSWL